MFQIEHYFGTEPDVLLAPDVSSSTYLFETAEMLCESLKLNSVG